jgi:tetratricopeptide (TPR) repeat protein
MFENIEKARQLLGSGSYRAAIDEFFRLINLLKEKNNQSEATRLLVEITSKIDETNDKRHIYYATDKLLDEIHGLSFTDHEKTIQSIDSFLSNVKILYRDKDANYEKAGLIAEAQIQYYENHKLDPSGLVSEAVSDYTNLVISILTKPRIRDEDSNKGNELLSKIGLLNLKINQPEKTYTIFNSIISQQLENKNPDYVEQLLDKAVNDLMKLQIDETKLLAATEEVMNAYVQFVDYQLADILNPEMPIVKIETIHFDNNIATRFLMHAKDICNNLGVKPALLSIARELSLIGLALFEKRQYEIAIPYFQEAKDLYLEVGNDDEALDFGNNLISFGLKLYTDERYPIGRDYFNIAIEIGQKVDRNFEVLVYQKQAENFLHFRKYQLAYEAYRLMIDPLLALPESVVRMDAPSNLRQLAKERFDKNDFHYAELFYRLTADYFLAFDQIELAADTYDSAWQSMFGVRQLQTGIDLAQKAAETYIKIGKEEQGADVYFRLSEQLFRENHFDIALERLQLAADAIPDYIQEQKFRPVVDIATKYTEISLKANDTINASALWKAACDFNETLARSLIKRDVNAVVETIEEHIKNVRKFDNEELNQITMESARGSGKVLSEAGENERAARIMISFATDFLRKDLTNFANPLFEEGAAEYVLANQPDEAARVLSTLARYHSEHDNNDLSLSYYLKASIEGNIKPDEKIYHFVAEHCLETYIERLRTGDLLNAEKGFDVALQIDSAVNAESAGKLANDIAKQFISIDQLDLALKYYQYSIDSFMKKSTRNAIVVAAETIERGRKAFQNKQIEESKKLILLGITSLQKAKQAVQAAQTARMEGEKFLSSANPEYGIEFLLQAIGIYNELKDNNAIADIYLTKGRYFLNSSELLQSLGEFDTAGKIYVNYKQKNEIKKIIKEILEITQKIIKNEITSTKEGESNQEEIAVKFLNLAEEFSVNLGDKQIITGVTQKGWMYLSQASYHDSAFIYLKKTFEHHISFKNNKNIIQLTSEIENYARALIEKDDLAYSIKYLNITVEILLNTKRQKEAAGLCVKTCEVFLKKENHEVAVHWALRATEILASIKMHNEAIHFLEELVEQLMVRNSIDNAIVCYAKIAKILQDNNRMDEVEEVALKVMAFGTANMKSNNQASGLKLWEEALTIGSIVGEEFTGRLCIIEGQTFYEIKDYEKSIELFKESFSLFKRVSKQNRLVDLGNTIFKIIDNLQKETDFDTSFKYLPIAFEAMIAGDELLLATENMFGNARKFIEIGRSKDGNHLINTTIDTLFTKGDFVGGVERCFIGAALLVSYGKGTEGSMLIDKGMEKISQITDESSIKHLATVCRNQGIILRDNDKLEASHVILASGIGILRTINDLVGIGQISIDLGQTLVKRNEMTAAVEAYRNGIQLMAQGKLVNEALNIVNDLITEGRKEIDNKVVTIGVPLVELAGELYLLLGKTERIMVVSEVFINLGGKMLNERNFDFAALYFSKAMEFATQAGLKDYLPKVGNRCIDFGLKLVKEGSPILGIQFMNAGADLISEFEEKPEKASRAMNSYNEALMQILSADYEKRIPEDDARFELIAQFVNSSIKFFSKTNAIKPLEQLSKSLANYGKKLLPTKDPRIVRRIFDPALRAAEAANNIQLQIEIANTYLDHVNYLIKVNKVEYLETTVNQALNIYLEVNDMKEIRKFLGIMTHQGRELSLKDATNPFGIKIIEMLTELTNSIGQQELYPVMVIPSIHLSQQALEAANHDLVIFARQTILRLLKSLLQNNLPLASLGNISFSNMISEWFSLAETLFVQETTFDQAIKIIDQSLQLAVVIQDVQLGLAVVDKVMELVNVVARRRPKGIDMLYEIIAIALHGLGQNDQVVEFGNRCLRIGNEAAERKRLTESINFLKAAGRIFALLNNDRLIAEVAIACASIGDKRLKDKNYKEGLYYYSAALENYELSKDENSIKLISSTIENLFDSTPVEDGYISFLVPGMVYANRNRIKEAEFLAERARKQADKMISSGKRDLIYNSIHYFYVATEIYERTGNIIEETNIYDQYMFRYLASTGDSKIVDLFLEILIKTLIRKLRNWDFISIEDIFSRVKDNRVTRNKQYQAIMETMKNLMTGDLTAIPQFASQVNVLFERSTRDYIDIYKEQVRDEILKTGKLSIHEYMPDQPISQLVNVLIQDLFGRKEIEGKYFPIGLFVSTNQLNNMITILDTELSTKGKAIIEDVAANTALTTSELLNVVRLEYLPQKFQALFNHDQTVLYSYMQLRNEVKDLALGFQEIGNVDVNKIVSELKFTPDIIQREIQYLVLEGKINPRLIGRT